MPMYAQIRPDETIVTFGALNPFINPLSDKSPSLMLTGYKENRKIVDAPKIVDQLESYDDKMSQVKAIEIDLEYLQTHQTVISLDATPLNKITAGGSRVNVNFSAMQIHDMKKMIAGLQSVKTYLRNAEHSNENKQKIPFVVGFGKMGVGAFKQNYVLKFCQQLVAAMHVGVDKFFFAAMDDAKSRNKNALTRLWKILTGKEKSRSSIPEDKPKVYSVEKLAYLLLDTSPNRWMFKRFPMKRNAHMEPKLPWGDRDAHFDDKHLKRDNAGDGNYRFWETMEMADKALPEGSLREWKELGIQEGYGLSIFEIVLIGALNEDPDAMVDAITRVLDNAKFADEGKIKSPMVANDAAVSAKNERCSMFTRAFRKCGFCQSFLQVSCLENVRP